MKLQFPSLFKAKRPVRPGTEGLVLPPPQDELAFEGGRSTRDSRSALPKFLITATDQLAQRGGDSFSRVRSNLRTAFTPSQPVQNPAMFAGRLELLSTMIRALEDQRVHLVLYGDRGIGKTSLLHMLTEAARDARYIVVYASCGAASNFDETFRAAALEVPLLFHSSYAPTTTEAEVGSTLADLLPPAGLSPRLLGDLFARLTGTRALIILDEFDRSESPQFRRELAELIKILSDRGLRVQLVIAGVAADLSDLVEHIPSIRRNILAVRVPLMSDAEIEALIQNGERVSGMSFDASARNVIKSVASGSPHVASLLCHHAALTALDDKRLKVTAADATDAVVQALDEIVPRISKAMRAQLDKALLGADQALTVLARASLNSGGRFDASAIDAAAPSVESATTAKKVADQLVKGGMILSAHDDGYSVEYSFSDDGVAPYLWFTAARRDLERRSKPAPLRAEGA